MEHFSCFNNCEEGFDIYQYVFLATLGGDCDLSLFWRWGQCSTIKKHTCSHIVCEQESELTFHSMLIINKCGDHFRKEQNDHQFPDISMGSQKNLT